MNYDRHDCRLCGAEVKSVLTLEDTPLANLFPDTPMTGVFYPLSLKQCVNCGHVQTGYVVADEELYGTGYKYETPIQMRDVFFKRAKELRTAYPYAKTVVEIGSNTGLFLHQLHDVGFNHVIGIDPSSKDPLTWKCSFTDKTANLVKKRIGSADLIVANNVFAHIDDLDSVFAGINSLLSETGSLVFEVQYLIKTIEHGTFDMFYHEHRDYHQIGPIAKFLQKHGLVLADYKILDTHGGSLRITARKIGKWSEIPQEVIDWGLFSERIDYEKQFIHDQITGKIVAFGAPAKATTLIHQFGLQDKISCCIDETPCKQGKYIAGTNIPVVSMPENIPNQMLLLSWNYEDIIRKRFPNVDFIVPFANSYRMAA